MDWIIEYYQKENGDIPVEDFLLTLNPKLRAKAYSDIMLLKCLGINIRAPYSTPVKGDKYNGIFELRTKFSSDIARMFYFYLIKINLYCYTALLRRPIDLQTANLTGR